MQFKAGDVVVHPMHGVGKVMKLEEKRLGDQARLYYQVITQKSTVWVPTESNGPGGLRPLTSKRELEQFRSLLKSRPLPLLEDHRKRQVEISDRMKNGSFQALCEIVRDLTARSWRRPLNDTDVSWLRKARERLIQEWAASGGISVAEAIREVDALLSEAREVYVS